MTRPTCPGKVAAVVTRVVDGHTELCVFDHAGAVQLPAGTLEPDEHPTTGAAREAWEETGLPHLELARPLATLDEYALDPRPNVALFVARHDGSPVTPGHTVEIDEHHGDTVTITAPYFEWTGTVDAACVTRDATRHVFHLRTTTPTPDEWWVLTPDGASSQWRCRWIALDGDEGLHPWQQRWIDCGRDRIAPGPTIERAEPTPVGAVELFWAMSGTRGIVVPHEGERPPAAGTPASAGAVCVTADGDVLLVTENPEHGWHTPGGRPEGDETPEQTLAREVREEACATVVDCELLVTHELLELDDHRKVIDHRWSPAFWARVELDEWAPEFEKTDRRLVPLAEVNDVLHWEAPNYLRWLELATLADARPR